MSWLSNIALTTLPSWPSRSIARHVLIGILLGFSFSLSSTSFALYYYQRQRKGRFVSKSTPRPIELRSDEIVKGVSGLIGMYICHHSILGKRYSTFSSGYQLIGNTPLVRINSLSDALGIEILGKAEVSMTCNVLLRDTNAYHTVSEPRRKCQRSCGITKYVHLLSSIIFIKG